MPHRKVGVKVVEHASQGRTRPASAAPARRAAAVDDVDPSFHRAILKIALELKKPSARTYGAGVGVAGFFSRCGARST